MDPIIVGKTISRQRKKLNLTQVQLAEMLNVSNKAVSRWENGVTMPDISLLIPLSDALHISLYDLLGGEAEAPAEGELLKETVRMSTDQVEKQKNVFLRMIINLMLAGLLVLTLAPWRIGLTSSVHLSVIDPPGFYVIWVEVITLSVLLNVFDQKNRTVNLISYAPLALIACIVVKNLIAVFRDPVPQTLITPIPVITCIYAVMMIAVHFIVFTKKQPNGSWLFIGLAICSLIALVRFWPDRNLIEPEMIIDPDPVYIEVYCKEEGFAIDAAYRRDVVDGYVYREYNCEGDVLDPKFRDLFASDVLETVSAVASGKDPIKQREVINAIGAVRNGTAVMLQGFTIDSGMVKKQDDITLSLVDCDLTDATWAFLNARELHLIQSRGLSWSGFASADMIENLIIDAGKDCSPEEAIPCGYYPESFSVFSANPTLRGISITVYLSNDELSLLTDHTAVLSSGNDSLPELFEDHLPYSLVELKTFLSENERKIGIRAVANDN